MAGQVHWGHSDLPKPPLSPSPSLKSGAGALWWLNPSLTLLRCGTNSGEPWDIAEETVPGAGYPAIQICQIWDPQEQTFMRTVQKQTADGSGNVNLPLILHPQTLTGNACRNTDDESD